ncbi:MAG: hypothetical protein RR461_08100 [Angelakisella sp.]
MRQKIIGLACLLIMLLTVPAQASEVAVSSTELIDRAKEYDGQTVVYSGEAVGNILQRGDFAWVALFDGQNAIGCYAPAADTAAIRFCGRYGIRGDTVSLTGVFHRACAEHGGDMDIHSLTFQVTEVGHSLKTEIPAVLAYAAGTLFLLALALIFLVIRKHR